MRAISWAFLFASAALCSGCPSTHTNIVAVGFDASTGWTTPGSIALPNTYLGGDVSWTLSRPGMFITPSWPTVGAYLLGRDGRSLGVAYVAVPTWCLVYAKPMIGVWNWSESPERSGLFTGLRLGIAFGDAGSFEFGWLWLNDADGEADAELRTVRIAGYLSF